MFLHYGIPDGMTGRCQEDALNRLPAIEAYGLMMRDQHDRRRGSELAQLVTESRRTPHEPVPSDLVVRLAGRPSLGHPVAVPFGLAERLGLGPER